ncbi:hypothetical protein EDB86DRAFT_3104234 [Lactarius hatsudake]|nr:hypothetical protein EDB86DRAFT_3104234 [Lactarius hatsudake]
MINADFLATCINLTYQDGAGFPASFSDCGFTKGFPWETETPHILCPLTDSNFEAYSDYYGLPSNPISVYHTGEWSKRPTGYQMWRVPKELRPVCDHPIADVWRELGQQIYQYLDSVNVKWTTIDPVRIAKVAKVEEEATQAGPLFLWVSVKPRSLSHKDAEVAAVSCKKILKESNLTDVEIAFRESVFTRSAGPRLLNHDDSYSLHGTVDVRRPLTPGLGLQIASRRTPCFEGTGGLYICEGGESQRVFILMAWHVVLPPSAVHNELYDSKTCGKRVSQHCDVLLLGNKRYQGVLVSIMVEIGCEAMLVDHYKDVLQDFGEASKDDTVRAKEREYYKRQLERAEEAIESLNEFHTEVTKSWSTECQHVLGHVVYSPPISVGIGPKLFTEDWALIELHGEKIDWADFKGNGIDLGTRMLPVEFMSKMYPNAMARTSFQYPYDHLLQLQGVVEEDELRHPTMLNTNGEACIIVVKSGNSTGVTISRATGIMSFVCENFKDGTHKTSMELPIYPYSQKDGAFSTPGDSGSIIADGKGRIVGLLTGGAGKTDSTKSDVTYASPFFWVFDERIKASFSDANLY